MIKLARMTDYALTLAAYLGEKKISDSVSEEFDMMQDYLSGAQGLSNDQQKNNDTDGLDDKKSGVREVCKGYSARQLSSVCSIPTPAAGKVLKILKKNGVLGSIQGPTGGYYLLGDPDKISVADIIVAMDGPPRLMHCSQADLRDCSKEQGCPVQLSFDRINSAMHQALSSVFLSDLFKPNCRILPKLVKINKDQLGEIVKENQL